MQWTITLAVCLVASLGVAVFICWPLLTGRPQKVEEDGENEDASVLDDLLVQKEATYSAIKELEFDHAMGNLSKQDYKELATRYEGKALTLLKTIDDVSGTGAGLRIGPKVSPAVAGVQFSKPFGEAEEEAIERQVMALRASRQKGGRQGRNLAEEIERDVAAVRAGRASALGGPGGANV